MKTPSRQRFFREGGGQSRVLSLLPVCFFRLRQCGFDPDELGSEQVGSQIHLMVLLSEPPISFHSSGRGHPHSLRNHGSFALEAWVGNGVPSPTFGFRVGACVGELERDTCTLPAQEVESKTPSASPQKCKPPRASNKAKSQANRRE